MHSTLRWILASSLTLLFFHLPAVAADEDPVHRQQLIDHVMTHWAGTTDAADIGWSERLEVWLYAAELPRLEAAALSRSREDLERALSGVLDSAPMTEFGQAGGNLVYFPLPPCRILDTRVPSPAGGRFAAGSTRQVHTRAVGTTFAALQGGAASDCGLTNTTAAEALVVNLTVVNPASAGFLTAWPSNLARPDASNVNYSAAVNLSNESTIRISALANQGMSVYSHRAADLVMDVLGYYARPVIAPLACYNSYTNVNLPPGLNTTAVSGTCAAGFTATGGGCEVVSQDLILMGSRMDSAEGGRRWHCRFRNPTATNGTANASVRCCQLPGR